MSSDIIKKVGDYYTGRIGKYGAFPAGVDWKNEESQLLRFEQLLKVINRKEEKFSILDFGCGYGSLFEFMQFRFPDFLYSGYDISEAMTNEAKKKFGTSLSFFNSLPENVFDYTVASGIFNVKLETPNDEWLNYIFDTLQTMNKLSSKGFSFNMLTKYSDPEYMRGDLYYADPAVLFDYCKTKLSPGIKYITLLHDYPLYEFTILVKNK